MARAETWTNDDGLVVGFGTRDTTNDFDSEVHTLGRVRQAEIYVDVTNVSDFNDGVLTEGSKRFEIPAGSVIVNTTKRVVTTITGSTAFDIGLKEASDGSTNDPNGLVAADTNLTADDVTIGAGALIDTVVATDQILSVTETGTMTAGQFAVLIEYIEPQLTQDTPAVIIGEI